MYLPVFFIASAIGGGIGMIIFESSLSHGYFKDQTRHHRRANSTGLTLGLGKAGALVGYMNFMLRWLGARPRQQVELPRHRLGSVVAG